MKTYRALICRIGEPPVVEEVNDDIRDWGAFVGGYFMQQHLDEGVYCICNEEGLHRKLPFNRNVPARAPHLPEADFKVNIGPKIESEAAPGQMGYHKFYGDFALVRIDAEKGEYASLSPEDVEKWIDGMRRMNP
jgi:hypothetical protein